MYQRPIRPRRRVLGLKLRDGRRLLAGATIITTGTFLNGLIHCGEERYPAGRSGEPASVLLGEALRALGLRTCRLKTGTPPRLDGRTIRLGGVRGAARRRGPHALQLPDQEDCAAADQLPHRLHHAGDAAHHPRECASLGDVFRADRGHRAALLPVDRRQDRQVSRQDAAPVLPGAGGAEHARGLRQRHVHLAADGGAVADRALDSRARRGGDAAPRLCHRIRQRGRHRTGSHACA